MTSENSPLTPQSDDKLTQLLAPYGNQFAQELINGDKGVAVINALDPQDSNTSTIVRRLFEATHVLHPEKAARFAYLAMKNGIWLSEQTVKSAAITLADDGRWTEAAKLVATLGKDGALAENIFELLHKKDAGDAANFAYSAADEGLKLSEETVASAAIAAASICNFPSMAAKLVASRGKDGALADDIYELLHKENAEAAANFTYYVAREGVQLSEKTVTISACELWRSGSFDLVAKLVAMRGKDGALADDIHELLHKNDARGAAWFAYRAANEGVQLSEQTVKSAAITLADGSWTEAAKLVASRGKDGALAKEIYKTLLKDNAEEAAWFLHDARKEGIEIAPPEEPVVSATRLRPTDPSLVDPQEGLDREIKGPATLPNGGPELPGPGL